LNFCSANELPDFGGGGAGNFFVLEARVADINQSLLGEMRDEAGVRAMFEHAVGPGLAHLPTRRRMFMCRQ